MKKIISLMLVLAVVFAIGPAYANTLTTSEDYIPSETLIQGSITVVQEERVLTDSKKEVKQLMKDCKSKMKAAKRMEEAAYDLEYEESHVIIQAAQQEWKNAKSDYNYYKDMYNDLLWEEKSEKYPAAAKIWSYLKDKGYSDYVCAGILGNIMAEVGGQTLNIDYWSSDNGYYGMCQWSVAYFPGVIGEDLNGQCRFLNRNLKKAMNSWGYLYAAGFGYEEFCALDDEQSVAYAFAKCYERCTSASYNQRMKNATVAYNYFKGA